MTQQVQRLEQEIGVPLFDRRGRSIQLNAAGRRFLPRAERVLRELAAAGVELGELGAERAPLHIAASPHVSRTLLPVALRQLCARRPGLQWSLSVVPSGEVADRVAQGLSQIGFTRQSPLRAGLRAEVVAEDPQELLVPHDGRDLEHPLPDAREALEAGPLFVCDPQATRVAIDDCLRARAIHPRETVYVGQVDVARSLLLAGFGAAFLPRSAVLPDLRTGRLLALDSGMDLPSDLVHALTPEDPSAPAQELLAICRRLSGF